MRLVLTAITTFLLLLVGCGNGEEAASPADGASPTPPEVATPPQDDSRNGDAAAGDASVAVVVDADGRVVVLDTDSGEEIRELRDGIPVDDPAANDIAVSPDGQVFVVVPPDDPSGESQIVQLPLEGGEPEPAAAGTVPAVSPDGGELAYVEYVEPEDSPEQLLAEPVLVLRDLASGAETRLTREEPFHFIPDVEWTGGGTRLAFTAGEIHTGLYVVDRDASSLDDAERLGPELVDPRDETSWGPVAAFQDGLAVVEACCDLPREERWTILAVDAADGTAHGPIRDERIEATHLDSDGEAAQLLIVVGGGPDGGQLLRWDGAGEPEEVADGVIVAAW